MKTTLFAPRRGLAWLGALLLCLLGAGQALAQFTSDIDIFSGTRTAGDRPNVLFLLDSSANWGANISGAANCFYRENGVVTANGPTADQGRKIGIEKCALYNLVDSLPVDPNRPANDNALFNIAIMFMNESPNDGNYPRRHFTPLTTDNKVALKALIAATHRTQDAGNNADYGQGMYEAYLYYKGLNRLNGGFGPNGKRDDAAFTGTRYNSPSTSSCGNNYVIVIGNGSPQNSNPEQRVEDLLRAAGGNVSPISVPAAGNDQANWSDEMARFMRGVDVSNKDDTQNIITYAIAVRAGPSDGGFPALMQSIAKEGGGMYYDATNADVLLSALIDIFNQIQAVNSVFSSVSLPVSVNASGTFANQIFMGMFRPDGDGKPRWNGNLKHYRFAFNDVTNSLSLVDAAGVGAVNPGTDFIAPGARSFWTTNSSFWANAPSGTPPSASDNPDGEVVEKGGVAQRLRDSYATAQTARRIYTCRDCAANTNLSTNTMARFNNGNTAITLADLAATSAAERTALLNWLNGTDNVSGAERGPGGTTTVRPSIHGDVLHSRPAVINYGGSTGVVVFYGGNDGMLRAINGNSPSTNDATTPANAPAIGGVIPGDELWSFVAQEHYGTLRRLRDNSPEIRLSTTVLSTVNPQTPRNYFFDGAVGIYQKINAMGVTERAIIYPTMRRGGQAMYAIDVTNPSQPLFLWKVTSASLSVLGQTWSQPRVSKVKGHANPVIVMGAGYDAAAEDAASPGTTTVGNAVLVIDAITGTLVKQFGGTGGTGVIDRSVPADVSIVDTNNDGFTDRAYAVDVGGNVYRIDFENVLTTPASNAPANWGIYKFAAMAGGNVRKFFFGPDVVLTSAFAAVLLGSGDREKPLATTGSDQFYTLLDTNKVFGTPPTAPSPIVPADLTANGVSPYAPKGCFMALETGEKVVNGAATIGGKTYFATNKPSGPSGNSCNANLGRARGYEMPLFCQAAAGQDFPGGGLPPSPVIGTVEIMLNSEGPDGANTPTTKRFDFIVGGGGPSCGSRNCVQMPNPAAGAPRKRLYWHTTTDR